MIKRDKTSEGFQETRQSLLASLKSIRSDFRSDPKALTQFKESLRKFVHELGEFKAVAERGRYPISRCFKERSERIARAAWDTTMKIETKSITSSEIEQILEMLQVNIGRISLNPYDGDDLGADGYDQEVDLINRRTMTTPVAGVWALLDLPRAECKCRQCQKRFGR